MCSVVPVVAFYDTMEVFTVGRKLTLYDIPNLVLIIMRLVEVHKLSNSNNGGSLFVTYLRLHAEAEVDAHQISLFPPCRVFRIFLLLKISYMIWLKQLLTVAPS